MLTENTYLAQTPWSFKRKDPIRYILDSRKYYLLISARENYKTSIFPEVSNYSISMENSMTRFSKKHIIKLTRIITGGEDRKKFEHT